MIQLTYLNKTCMPITRIAHESPKTYFQRGPLIQLKYIEIQYIYNNNN